MPLEIELPHNVEQVLAVHRNAQVFKVDGTPSEITAIAQTFDHEGNLHHRAIRQDAKLKVGDRIRFDNESA